MDSVGVGSDRVRADASSGLVERLGWRADWMVEKWHPGRAPEDGAPDEVVEFRDNLLLNEGITRLLNLLAGTTTNPYSNANARLGVGTSNTAAAASQTALQAGGVFKAMDATYPTVAAQTITFRSTFGSADANQAWEEFSVDNGSGPNENLNRKVQSLGTKVVGSTWILTVTITLS